MKMTLKFILYSYLLGLFRNRFRKLLFNLLAKNLNFHEKNIKLVVGYTGVMFQIP